MAETEITSLYETLLRAWNDRSAEGMAALFAEDGNVVGFDGSIMNGRSEIAATLGPIFADHPTPAYVWKVREIRQLTPDVALLRAVVGMVAPGKSELIPAVNAIQTLVATRRGGRWWIDLFQNTPAAFHGRPHLSEQLTEELREVLRSSQR